MSEAVGARFIAPGALEPVADETGAARLLDLIDEVNQGSSLERVFALVVDGLRQIFDIDRYAVVLLGPDSSLTITTSYGLSPRYLAAVRERIGEGAGARALAHRRPIYIPDATISPDFAPFQQAADDEGFRSVLVLPLFSGADPLGYLIMYHDELRTYTAAEIVLAQALAQQAAIAVQNTRLLAATEAHRAELERRFQQRVAEVEIIDDIVLGIASSLDPERTLNAIAAAAAALAEAAYSCIYLRDADRTYRPVAAHGVPMERLQRVVLTGSDGLMADVLKTQEPVQVTDFAHDVTASPAAREETELDGNRATLAVPLTRDHEVIGALYVGRTEEGLFHPDTVRAMQRLASFAQVALQNAQRFSNVEAERRQLQMFLDAVPEGVIVFDAEGRVVLFNDSFRRELRPKRPLTGMTRQEMLARHEENFARPITFRYDRDSVFDRVIATGQSEQGLLEADDPPATFEVSFNSLRDDDGTNRAVVATFRDITSPLDLERERTRSHVLAQLLDLSAQLNSALSVPLLLERVVEAATTLVGAEGGTVGLLEGSQLVFRRLRLGGRWTDIEVTAQRGQGISGHVWETMQPYVANHYSADPHAVSDLEQRFHIRRLVAVPMIDSGGELVGTLEVQDPMVEREFGQLDVEALQLLANQAAIAIENARLNQLKDEFLSVVSHELKTPVTSIKGFTQVLQRRLSPESLERCGRYLEVINHQTDRLTTLINDLLDLTRIQHGRFSFELTPLDYARLVRETVDEMRLMVAQHTIELSAPDSLQIQGNADRLQQVLVNLIDNAAKYGPAKGDIRVTVERRDAEVLTCVQDQGQGLPAGEEEQVFAPYHQIRQPNRRHAQGLGLGLYVSRQIVEEHGGRIWLGRAKHTTFCFSLPLAPT